MKMSRKFITAGVAGVMALGIAVSAWAAEPQITDQKIRSGGVTVNVPVVKGAVGGAEVDDKVNMAIDFNIVKKLYAYLPGGSNGLSLQENYYPEFDGYGGLSIVNCKIRRRQLIKPVLMSNSIRLTADIKCVLTVKSYFL